MKKNEPIKTSNCNETKHRHVWTCSRVCVPCVTCSSLSIKKQNSAVSPDRTNKSFPHHIKRCVFCLADHLKASTDCTETSPKGRDQTGSVKKKGRGKKMASEAGNEMMTDAKIPPGDEYEEIREQVRGEHVYFLKTCLLASVPRSRQVIHVVFHFFFPFLLRIVIYPSQTLLV